MKLKVDPKNHTLVELSNTGIFHYKSDKAFLVLAGGAIRAMITDETPNDLDLFIVGDDPMLKAQILDFLDEKYDRIFTCPEGFLTSFKGKGMVNQKIQLITPMIYTDVEHLLSTFDLSPCVAAYDGEYVYLEKAFIRDVKKKNCRLVNLTFPLATMNRIHKYRSYGYKVHEAQTEFLRLVRVQEFSDDILNRRYID